MKKLYLSLFALLATSAIFAQSCSDLFFSEYVEGSSNNKALEIYNPGSVPVDLTGYSVLLFANGSATPTTTFALTGFLNAGDVYVIVNSQANDSIKARRDTISGVVNFNGDDAIALLNGSDTLDIIGVIGFDPGASWTVDSGTTLNQTLVRKETVQEGTKDWLLSATQWYALPTDTIRLGSHSMNSCGIVADTLVRFSPNSATTNESVGSYTINIVLNASNPTDTLRVDVEFTGGTGTLDDIGNFTTQTVSFLPGAFSSGVQLSITDDTIQEPSETFIFRLVNPVGGVLIGADSIFTLTIGASDVPVQTVLISEITSLDTSFVPDSLGKTVLVTGTVYGINTRSTGLQFTIHDNTDGIQIFSPAGTFGYTVTEGDSVAVRGQVGFFNGMTQLIQVDTLYELGTGVLQAPFLTPDLDESTESELVRLNNVTLVTPSQWDTAGNASGFNCDITDGVGTWTMRIDEQTDIFRTNMPAPAGAFHVIGLGGQFDNSAPYNSGYQILPRYTQDIIIISSVSDLRTNSFYVYPNPNKGNFMIQWSNENTGSEISLYDLAGRLVYQIFETSQFKSIQTDNLQSGLYLLQVKTGRETHRSKICIEK